MSYGYFTVGCGGEGRCWIGCWFLLIARDRKISKPFTAEIAEEERRERGVDLGRTFTAKFAKNGR